MCSVHTELYQCVSVPVCAQHVNRSDRHADRDVQRMLRVRGPMAEFYKRALLGETAKINYKLTAQSDIFGHSVQYNQALQEMRHTAWIYTQ